MFTSTKIADLQTKVGNLESQLAESADALASLRADFEATSANLATAEAQVTAHAATIASLESASVQASADFEAAVNTEVTARLAGAGADPVARDPQARTGEPKELTRAEFRKLKAGEKREFCAAGGKVTD
jgi:BMFP domain-containing protein YqiC